MKTHNVDLGSKGSFSVHKGKLHRALGIPEDEPIGQKRIDSAMHSKKPSIRDMAKSAKGLTHMAK
jgi:hypothetical protein